MIRVALRWLLALSYAIAGALHLVAPEPFVRIVEGFVPFAEQVVKLTGIAELLGAVALAQPWEPRLRRAGAIGLALYALCVWPANVNHMLIDLDRADGGLGLAYHVPRLLMQPVLIWLALWTGGVLPWKNVSATRAR
ncbi:hypothetical protein GRI75_10765 [Altererythrobacter soli]|uniref:DoxX family membrane protein n=1 Tax=Croceibacterium soli TaxID=1739690 RepID=A0A6I4UTK2_9SPHN|nr:DoxX family protein [Croceibacterium soli]MXP42121.1 hypothetical protein [Croceibacterium soli]